MWSQHRETSVIATAFSLRGSAVAPLDLHADHIDDLVRQTRYVLVAEVDGDAGVMLLHISGSIRATLADVLAGVVEGGLCEGDHLVVRNGHRRVVAHDERRSEKQTAAESCADMLMQQWGASIRGGCRCSKTGRGKEQLRNVSR